MFQEVASTKVTNQGSGKYIETHVLLCEKELSPDQNILFISWEFLLVKKLEIKKTKTTKITKYTTFKTDTYNKSGLSFFDLILCARC